MDLVPNRERILRSLNHAAGIAFYLAALTAPAARVHDGWSQVDYEGAQCLVASLIGVVVGLPILGGGWLLVVAFAVANLVCLFHFWAFFRPQSRVPMKMAKFAVVVASLATLGLFLRLNPIEAPYIGAVYWGISLWLSVAGMLFPLPLTKND